MLRVTRLLAPALVALRLSEAPAELEGIEAPPLESWEALLAAESGRWWEEERALLWFRLPATELPLEFRLSPPP